MGSLKKSRITDQEIVRRYQEEGEGVTLISLRAGMTVNWTRTRLIDSGVTLRSLSEASALAGITGRAHRARLAARKQRR